MRLGLFALLALFSITPLTAVCSETTAQAVSGTVSEPKVQPAATPVWVDVRSWAEHQWDGIDNDLHISHREIVEGIVTQFPDKQTPIKLYCAAGVRAASALQALQQAGYTNIENAGGIDEVRKRRAINAK